MKGDSCVRCRGVSETLDFSSSESRFSHLESSKPHALHLIANQYQILEDTDAGHIDGHVEEGDGNEAFLEIKCFDEDLDGGGEGL